MNLEQRLQKTNKIFNSYFDNRHIKNIFASIFNLKHDEIFMVSLCFNFLYEILKHAVKINFLDKKLTFLKKSKLTEVFFSLYPLKPSIEDYYRSNE